MRSTQRTRFNQNRHTHTDTHSYCSFSIRFPHRANSSNDFVVWRMEALNRFYRNNDDVNNVFNQTIVFLMCCMHSIPIPFLIFSTLIYFMNAGVFAMVRAHRTKSIYCLQTLAFLISFFFSVIFVCVCVC